MSTEELIMKFDKPYFTVRLHKSLLEVDLKEGFKKELEDAAERSPRVRASLGYLLQLIVPLDVPLKDIEDAGVDKRGQVKLKIPHRRDITVPLDPDESEKLVNKLKELIPIEKQKEIDRLLASREAQRELARERVPSRIGEADVLGREKE
jgi:hypothetical protein